MIVQTAQNIRHLQLTKRRIAVISIGFLFWAVIIGLRLVHYQVFKHQEMIALAERQQQRTIKTSPKRGAILDTKGRELACSLEVTSIYVAPSEIKTPAEIAPPLAKILDLNLETVLARLTSRRVLVSLKRKVSEKEANEVKALNLPGIHFVTETKRFYPKDELAASVLGFVGLDDDGFAGVERQYDRHIQGRDGYVFVEADAYGKPFARYEKQAEIGQSLVLTLDEQIQFRTEKALREGATSLGARGGVAIVMKPKTGEILAMANLPAFNPNQPINDSKELHNQRRNRAIEDAYEPGSVFKIVTYSAALEAGLIKPEDKIDCQGGMITIADHTIRDGGHYGLLTASEAMEVSSNVAAIKVGRRLGKDLLLETINRFGFGQATNVGLPGESPGFVGGTAHWSDASFGALPIGYQVGVTPLQLIAAMAAIANNGEWVQPHILKHITATTGDIIYKPKIETRRVIKEKTAQTMKNMLEGVVVRGTAKHAQLDGYSAAGKTGTAHKYDNAKHRYAENRYFASFAGFAPINNPAIAVLVVIDEPRLGMHHGGQAAAPIFKEIAQMALSSLSIPPDNPDRTPSGFDKPEVIEDDIMEEYEEIPLDTQPMLKATNNTTSTNIENDNSKNEAKIAVVSVSAGNGGLVMPDLIGQGIRTALARTKELDLKLTFEGLGDVAEQYPAAGTAVAAGTSCHVVLKKRH